MESRPFSDHFRPGRTFFTEIDFRDRAKMEPFEILDTILERETHILRDVLIFNSLLLSFSFRLLMTSGTD